MAGAKVKEKAEPMPCEYPPRNAASVSEDILKVDASIEDVIKYVVSKHVEFEKRFDVLRKVNEKAVEVDASKAVLLAATYPSIASWNLTESVIADTRYDSLKSAYDVWFSQRSPYAENVMAVGGEHKTIAAIEAKVSVLYPDEYVKWKEALIRAKADKDILSKRIGIIHDSRYSINSLSQLSNIWNTQSGATQFDSSIIAAAGGKIESMEARMVPSNTAVPEESNPFMQMSAPVPPPPPVSVQQPVQVPQQVPELPSFSDVFTSNASGPYPSGGAVPVAPPQQPATGPSFVPPPPQL